MPLKYLIIFERQKNHNLFYLFKFLKRKSYIRYADNPEVLVRISLYTAFFLYCPLFVATICSNSLFFSNFEVALICIVEENKQSAACERWGACVCVGWIWALHFLVWTIYGEAAYFCCSAGWANTWLNMHDSIYDYTACCIFPFPC